LVFVSALTPDKGRDIATLMRNLRMGENVSASLKDSGCSHIIYISSDAVYDDGAELITETTGANPSSFHGVMHLTRERMLAYTAGDAGLPLLILRPSLLYGPDDTHNGYGPNRFLSTAKNDGVITLFGNGEEKRDHVYIADLARLIGLSLMSRTEGVLNVATGVSVSFFDVAQTIAGLGEKKVEIECLPRAMPVTHRHFDTADGIKAFSSFQYTPVQSGIPETYDKLGAAHK
jgi:UDP-glucose 4-epimerase